VLTKENVGVLEALEEDLETARLGREGLLLAMKLATVPEWIVK
jgi:hypothetical protein